MESKNFTVLSSKSFIYWTGRKVIGSHNGTIAIKEGYVTLINGELEAGKLVADTTSVRLAGIGAPVTNAQFEALLTSGDFLSSGKFPEAIFEIISVFKKTDTVYCVEGNLTIRGTTEFASFDANIYIYGDTLNATARFRVNRNKYKINARSGNLFSYIKDAFTYNNIDLSIEISAKVMET